jgi:hypothetical protein
MKDCLVLPLAASAQNFGNPANEVIRHANPQNIGPHGCMID